MIDYARKSLENSCKYSVVLYSVAIFIVKEYCYGKKSITQD
jgi:hypothetical protein